VLLVLAELRRRGGLAREELVARCTARLVGAHRHGLRADLDGHVGVRDEVVVPVGVGGRAGLRREDHELLSIAEVGERVDALLPGLATGRVEQEYLLTLERSAELPGVGAELLDDHRVPVVGVARRHSQLPWSISCGLRTCLLRPATPPSRGWRHPARR